MVRVVKQRKLKIIGIKAENNSMRRRVGFFLINHVYCGTKHFEKKYKIMKKMGFEIGENTKIVGPIICTTSLKIGKNCWIGKNLLCNGNGSVVIGDNCDRAPEVTFQTGGHEIGSFERRAGEGRKFTQIVGDGTWIGGRSTILGNTTIGKGCVIAGCACVTKDVPESTLVGGVPAKVIRKLEK